MSGWPWMKGETVSIADATTVTVKSSDCDNNDNIDDDDSYSNNSNSNTDKRPIVKELIIEYRDLIDQVRNELINENDSKKYYDETKHDDLWILRFLLSHKKDIKNATQAAISTIQFRYKFHLDDKDIRKYPPQTYRYNNNETETGFHRFMNNGGIGNDSISVIVPDYKKYNYNTGVIYYFNISTIDTHKLALLEQDDWIVGMNYVNEYTFQWLDYITRITGKLTKAIHIVDIAGISFNMYDNTTQTKYTNATKYMQNYYPQLVQSYQVCHAPIWIEGPWKLIKPLLPKRVVEKLDFLNPKQRIDDKDKLLQLTNIPDDLLPVRFGGKYESWPVTIPPPI